ncbi:hypothetical protein GEMRC1_003751 [Eukaryota sp. GEM-RC1]
MLSTSRPRRPTSRSRSLSSTSTRPSYRSTSRTRTAKFNENRKPFDNLVPSASVSLHSLNSTNTRDSHLKDDLSLSQTLKSHSTRGEIKPTCSCGCDCCSDGYVKILQELISEHEQRERDMTLKLKELEHTRSLTLSEINKYREKVEAAVVQLEERNSTLETENDHLQGKVDSLEESLKTIRSVLNPNF